jgi:mannonate dehydratase
MKLALAVGLSEKAARFAAELGVRHVVGGLGTLPQEYAGVIDLDVFLKAKEFYAGYDLELDTLEGFPHGFYHRAMLGRPGRDEDIDNTCASILNMGRAGIHVLSYQWMPLGGLSTDVIRGRGGATERRFDMESANRSPGATLDWHSGPLYELPDREYSGEEIWDNLTYFLERVVPVAEEAGVKLAMHPDDPPIPSFLGVDRILGDLAGLQRLIDTVPSPSNGLNFCQGCVSEMPGVDVPAAIRQFGTQDKVFFAHFRDTRGTVPRFDEVFMDEGDTDMFAAMKAYKDAGVDVCMRADHTPGVIGDNHCADRGFAFQFGYMQGLAQAVDALPATTSGT